MSGSRFDIQGAPQFDFERTVLSHGWLMLAPFSWDDVRRELHYNYQTRSGDVQRLRIQGAEAGVRLHLPDAASPSNALQSELTDAVRRLLNMDWDLGAFYAAMRQHAGYDWIEAERRGRILIAPSLWEDLAKVLLTTNCSWSQTVNMCRQLCQLGAPHPTIEGCRAFPTAERIADMDFDEFAEAVRAGYRSAYLHEMARKIAEGEINLDAWLNLESGAMFAAVKSLKGFGDYAAGTIARMYGHFDRIAIDTACHAMFAERHNGGVKGSVKQIQAHYEIYGEWRGLVMWMDIMRQYEG